MKKADYELLIVGQGIAGTTLAETFIRNGKRVLVADNHDPQSSSQVAAGIYNPITGRKMTKTWLADQLFPYLISFYSELEQKLNTRFFYPKNLYYPFDSQEKQNDWLVAMAEPKYHGYIKGFHEDGLYPDAVINSHGGMEITQSGYVDLKTLLTVYREFLRQRNALSEDGLNYADLSVDGPLARWQGKTFEKVIFCEGEKVKQNPWFNWLDFRPVKGEILTIRLKGQSLDHIINRNGWTLPWHDGTYKTGATYDNRTINTDCTEAARSFLLEKMEGNLKNGYEVVGQIAGIRPATYDRRPFIGFHPENEKLGIFNGMGAKGVSLSPWLAQHFLEHTLLKNPLLAEVDIARDWKRKMKKGTE